MSDTAHLIAFARVWSHYGGGSAEDIFVEFGLTENEYFTRLDKVLRKRSPDISLAADELARIKRVCGARLHGHAVATGSSNSTPSITIDDAAAAAHAAS